MLKLAHVACVVISGSLFIYRYARLNRHPDRPLAKALKVLPHINDTVLLFSAIGMLSLIGLNPFTTPWLLTKIVALRVYRARDNLYALPAGLQAPDCQLCRSDKRVRLYPVSGSKQAGNAALSQRRLFFIASTNASSGRPNCSVLAICVPSRSSRIILVV